MTLYSLSTVVFFFFGRFVMVLGMEHIVRHIFCLALVLGGILRTIDRSFVGSWEGREGKGIFICIVRKGLGTDWRQRVWHFKRDTQVPVKWVQT
jgi:hypothetical protein